MGNHSLLRAAPISSTIPLYFGSLGPTSFVKTKYNKMAPNVERDMPTMMEPVHDGREGEVREGDVRDGVRVSKRV